MSTSPEKELEAPKSSPATTDANEMEIEPLSDEALEDVAGGVSTVSKCPLASCSANVCS